MTMKTTHVIDSDRRCPHCSKLMILDVGQDDMTGEVRMVHDCWGCGYKEIDRDWPPRRSTSANGGADRLQRLRLEGTVLPLHYDTEPFPVGEFDE